MNMFMSRTKNTKDYWETPPYFFKLLDDIFHFTLDPCAEPSTAKCEKYYTEQDDGLSKSWEGETVFVNPPFSNSAEWIEKCYYQSLARNTTVVMIIPSRTDTIVWHNYVMSASEIWFCVGRVNFLLDGIKPKNGSTFPLAVIVFKGDLVKYPSVQSFHHKHKRE